MLMVNRPSAAEAVTLGIAAVIMACAKPTTVLPVLAGTATGMLLISIVSPAVNEGLSLVDVIVPYTRAWLTFRCTEPAANNTVPSTGAPI